MAIFLDDSSGGGINSITAKINSLTVRADLTWYGFVINEEKSLREPVQVQYSHNKPNGFSNSCSTA